MAALNLDLFWDNIDTKCTLWSDVPSDVGSRECILGIDEAGRGPVLGPMVYGASYCPVSMKDQLKHMGFADSKTLSEASREKYFEKINCSSHLGWIVEILSPNYISNLMLRRTKYNLNSISHDSAAGLINKLLQRNINITEVARDHVVSSWKFPEMGHSSDNEEFGSGYPADPITKQWLASNTDHVFGFPSVVRFSWSTAANILASESLPVHWEDDEDTGGSAKITQFFSSKRSTTQDSSHRYFRERNLKFVTCL
ncbi:ribonuclease H2 subunit A-like isoform X2 [Dysidea avara]|uniref:ribonuclease H2 subunit A-like isoform X2 n=1 Tax=Dysidea avara TaxID=196820 RepID=UPI003325F9C3